MRAILEPRPQFGGVLQHAVLDVNLVLLVAREGGIEAGQEPVAVKGGQLVLEQEIGVAPRIAEEQPIAADGAGRAALLQKGAERRDPGAGADHDQRRIVVLGQPEIMGLADEYRNWFAESHAIGKPAGGDAVALPAAQFVAHGCDGQVDAPLRRFWRRGNRIETWLQRSKGRDQFLQRRTRRRKALQQFEQVGALRARAGIAFSERLQTLGFVRLGSARGEHLDRLIGDAADLADAQQRLFQAAPRPVGAIDFFAGPSAEQGDDRCDSVGAVLRLHPEHVADLVGEPGAAEVE